MPRCWKGVLWVPGPSRKTCPERIDRPMDEFSRASGLRAWNAQGFPITTLNVSNASMGCTLVIRPIRCKTNDYPTTTASGQCMYLSEDELDDQLKDFVKMAERELNKVREGLTAVDAEHLDDVIGGLEAMISGLGRVKFEATRLVVEAERQMRK